MTDPIYTYVKGEGWAPRVVRDWHNYLYDTWAKDDDRGNTYPSIAVNESWEIDLCESSQLKPGDIIPFSTTNVWVVLEISETYFKYADLDKSDESYQILTHRWMSDCWSGVARCPYGT